MEPLINKQLYMNRLINMNPQVCIIETPGKNLSPSLQSFLAREALKSLLRRHFGLSELPEIAYDDRGKPFFRSTPGIHFSLSHSKSAVMAAVGRCEIGCDIEDILDDDIEDLLYTAFSEQEQATILKAPRPNVELCALWTAKEAYVKRSGVIPDAWPSVPSSAPGIITVTPENKPFVYSYSVSPK